jgi:hypothetical protein
MYDLYPEWGPARNRPEDLPEPAAERRPRYWQSATTRDRVLAMAGAPAARDAEADRPDDN